MLRTGALSGPLPAEHRPGLPAELAEAMDVFNMMGGLDWAAIPYIFPIFKVRDPAAMIRRLAYIRDAYMMPKKDG